MLAAAPRSASNPPTKCACEIKASVQVTLSAAASSSASRPATRCARRCAAIASRDQDLFQLVSSIKSRTQS